MAKVQLGEADAGIVYRSDVTPAVARYVRVFEIPERTTSSPSYPIAVVKSAPHPDAARAFVASGLRRRGTAGAAAAWLDPRHGHRAGSLTPESPGAVAPRRLRRGPRCRC